jgi:hypothetical protein
VGAVGRLVSLLDLFELGDLFLHVHVGVPGGAGGVLDVDENLVSSSCTYVAAVVSSWAVLVRRR